MMYIKKQIDEISHGQPSEIASFITNLLLHIEKLETRVKVLERQVGLSSSNSSKPKSMRTSGGKNGAPKNHDGHTLLKG